MRYIKTFESFSINEEENIFQAVGGFFGKFNDDTKMRAEKAIDEWNERYPDNKHVEIFNQLRDAYDSKSGTTLLEQNGHPFKYPTTELSTEDVKKLFEDICCIIRMNEAKAFGIGQNKEGKLEAYQSTSYSATQHGFGSGVAGH